MAATSYSTSQNLEDADCDASPGDASLSLSCMRQIPDIFKLPGAEQPDTLYLQIRSHWRTVP